MCVKPSHLRVTTTRVNTCAGLVGALGANRQTSRFLGVSWCRSSHGWKASIRIDHVRRYLGLFDDETEAARAYDDAREAVDDVRPNGTKR